jgi:hypothetical protein
MAYGISQEVDQLQGLSIQELMRRHSVDPKLVYAIALQEKTKMEDAKNRQGAMAQQPPQPADLVGQMEVSLARPPQMQMPMSPPQGQMPPPQGPQAGAGIASLPAANMAKMAGGGIVAFADGGSTSQDDQRNADARRYMAAKAILNNPQASVQAKANAQAEIESIKAQAGMNEYSNMMQKVDAAPSPAKGVKGFAAGEGVNLFPSPADTARAVSSLPNLVPSPVDTARAVAFLAEQGIDAAKLTAEQIAEVIRNIDMFPGKEGMSTYGTTERPSIGEVVRTGAGNARDAVAGAVGDAREFMADRNDNTGQAATLRGVGQGISEVLRGRGTIGQNNPFNLRDYNQNWEGQTGATEGFVDYEDERSGVRAADKLLENYGKQGVATIRDIVSKFAPANENDTEAYINFVSEQTGIPSEQPIDMGNAADRRKVLAAMGQMESGYKTDADEITAMLNSEGREAIGTDGAGNPIYKSDFDQIMARTEAPSQEPRGRGIKLTPLGEKVVGGISSIPSRIRSMVDSYQNTSSDGSGMSPEELAAAYAMVDEASAEKPNMGISPQELSTAGTAIRDYYEDIKEAVAGQDTVPGQLGAGFRAVGESAAEIGGKAAELGGNAFSDFLNGLRGVAPTEGRLEAMVDELRMAGSGLESTVPQESMVRTGTPTFVDKLKSAAVRTPPPTSQDDPQENGGISAATPTGGRGKLDKLMGVLEILGRGAGASKGYEFSKIADETSKIRAAEADRDARLQEANALADARKEEREMIIAANQQIANQEMAAEMATQAMAAMQVDPAYTEALTALEAEFTSKDNDYFPFNEEFDAEGFAAAKRKLEEEYIAKYAARMQSNTSMAQFGGASGANATPATSRYSVVDAQ